ncbi:hypothetical protein ACIJDF_002551 [Enterococcus hirae]
MKIIYPPLVEQAYQFLINQGVTTTKDKVYKMMVNEGTITETGIPTKTALEEGIFKEFNQKHKTLGEFIEEYPIFKHYPPKEFTQQDGIWYVSQKIIRDIQEILKVNNCDRDTFIQIEAYFKFRNYENPHGSISEIKGVYHPLYTPYDDSEFQFVDGLVAIPYSIISDIVRRCESGELDVEEKEFLGFKEILERLEDQSNE